MEKVNPTVMYSSTSLRMALEILRVAVKHRLTLWNVKDQIKDEIDECIEGHISLYWDENEQQF